jgi:hypothetical protein
VVCILRDLKFYTGYNEKKSILKENEWKCTVIVFGMQYPCEMDIQSCTNENASVYWDCQIFTLALLGYLLGNNFLKTE